MNPASATTFGSAVSQQRAGQMEIADTPAWVTLRFDALLTVDEAWVLGRLSDQYSKAGFRHLESDQIAAWRTQLGVLRNIVQEAIRIQQSANGWVVALEFEIPRRNKRIDAVVLTGTAVILLEFKIGSRTFERHDLDQTQDYKLDLRDFHEASRGLRLEAVLVATEAALPQSAASADRSTGVWRATPATLATAVLRLADTGNGRAVDPNRWLRSGYRPTPTIIEAARRIFAGHDIRELSHAYADNLSATTATITRIIDTARREQRRVLCVVTGVPGAGKTLAGLTAMQDARNDAQNAGVSAFMSGNGPLVKVLREALVRDRVARGASRTSSAREVSLLIQNVHRFIEEYGVRDRQAVPPEHIIAFDEAQRAWHAAKFRKRHKAIAGSEPDLVLDIMSRPEGWAVVVALVGGGQEIHDGEAGLEAWGDAVRSAAARWDVAVSPDVLHGGTSVAGHRLFASGIPADVLIRTEPSLHLSVTVRSPRAQRLAEWVNSVIDLNAATARQAIATSDGFRLFMTRELDQARSWLRAMATGHLRAGLLASSGAIRLRAHGLEVDANFRKNYPFVRWFLDDRDDYRSAHSLEVPATDFECQGLEIDYACVCWGDDLTVSPTGSAWACSMLRGARSHTIRGEQKQRYLLNKYRVLLTRSREGMVIWVPHGDTNDPTRPPDALDRTAAFLERAGVTPL